MTKMDQLPYDDEHFVKNLELLLKAAERQHLTRMEAIEKLDRKLTILLAAQSAVLWKGTEINWGGGHLFIVWSCVGLLTLISGGVAFFIWPKRESPGLLPFREKHVGKKYGHFCDELISNYTDTIQDNVRKNKIKAGAFNFALITLFISILLYGARVYL